MRMRWHHAVFAGTILAALIGCTDGTNETSGSSTTATTPPSTTTPTFDMANFSMDQVADGPPLSWSPTLEDESLFPAGLVDVGGVVYVFAEDFAGHGVRGWSSVDGANWDDLGQILPEEVGPALVTAAEDQILLVTGSRAGQHPEVWSSHNGSDWSSEEIPIETDNELVAFSPTAVAAASGMTIVTGELSIDASGLLEGRLRATLWPTAEADRFDYTVRETDDDIEIDILGPGGLTLLTTTANELGIDARHQTWLLDEPQSGDAEVWASFAGGEWGPAIIDGASSVQSLSATADGAVVAAGLTELEQLALWISFDGYLWEQLPFAVRPYELASWNGTLVGPSDIGGFNILTSDDGVEWVETGLGAHFPPSQRWYADAIGTSSNGLVVAAETFDIGPRGGFGFELPFLTKGDLEILLDAFSGSLTVLDGEETHTWTASPSDTLVFEPTTETVTLFRDDGSELVDITLTELEDLARSYGEQFGGLGSFYRALAVTSDGVDWTIWDLAALGEETGPTGVALTPSTLVVAATNHLTDRGFTVWTTPLP